MSYQPIMKLSPPSNWGDFENLCWSLWKKIWNDPNAEKNGRQGQPQNGVDIFGRPSQQDKWVGVQCKGKENFTYKKLTKKEIDIEVEKARTFVPELSEYIIATTAPRDSNVQQYVREKTVLLEQSGTFSINVRAWNDIEELVYEHVPQFAITFWPSVFGGGLGPLMKQLLQKVPDSQGHSHNLEINSDICFENDDGAIIVFNPQTENNRDLIHDYAIDTPEDRSRILNALARVLHENFYGSNNGDLASQDLLIENSINQVHIEENEND